MSTLTASCLFRFLLSLVIRLRRSLGRTVLALRACLTSLCRLIFTFASRRGQSRFRLHVNDVPMAADQPTGEHPVSGDAKADDESAGTLATLPVRGRASWEDELLKHQTLTPSHKFSFQPIPATPEGASQRYRFRKTLSQTDGLSDIPAGQRKLLSALPQVPNGWRRHVHPEGNVLFYHEGLRIFTETNVIEHGNDIIFCATVLIQQALKNEDVILDELTEVVLNMDDSQCWYYYFVDHRNHLLFWLQPVRPREDLSTDVQGISEYSHIRYLVEAQYCISYDLKSRSHCEYYPHKRTVPTDVFENLRGMLNYAKTDMMTTDSSSSPFAQDELVAILDLINSLKDDKAISNSSSVWIVARLMSFFTENQFLNFCGQECARLNADTPLFGQQTWNRSKVFKVVNVLLFGSPSDHAVRLQRVWVDGIIIQPRWKDFVSRLTNELSRYTIFSTVMLAVNISFLAVPGVVATNPPAPANSIVIIIYCSVVSTVGSLAFSFALLNVYSDPGLMVAGLTAEAMRTLGQTSWGMACLATTHSLPIACLVWSMVLFSTALAIQIFSPKDLATITTLGVECLILVFLASMSVYVMRLFSRSDESDDTEDSEEKDPDVEQGSTK